MGLLYLYLFLTVEDKCLFSYPAALPPGRYANLCVPSARFVLRCEKSFYFYVLFRDAGSDCRYAVTNGGMIYE